MGVFTKLLMLYIIAAVSCNSIPPEGKRLIQLGADIKPVWLSEAEVYELIREDKHFFDRTDHQDDIKVENSNIKASTIPTVVSYSDLVKSAKSSIDKSVMSEFLTSYSKFHNRFYNTTYGVKASNFLYEKVNRIASGYKGHITVNSYKHRWPQPSIITTIEGSNLNSEVVIIAAHLDSINKLDPENGIAPGADDDGSGTTTVLEILRILTKMDFRPRRTLEFHFYAAEEVGLIGSQEIAEHYATNGVKVVGMLQFDMTGYHEKDNIKVVNDFTDPELSEFLRLLVRNYVTYELHDGRCGYACSDHASFYKVGFKTALPFPFVYNRKVHSQDDVIDTVNFDQVAEFVSLGLGFAIELAMPSIKKP